MISGLSLADLPSVVARSGRVSLGNRGEDIACRELQRRGYAIVARHFRTRAGEIDIIARDGVTLVFVEVRTRSSHQAGTAAESVDERKRAQIGRMAAAYLGTHGTSREPCRFDVVTVEFEQGAANPENPGSPENPGNLANRGNRGNPTNLANPGNRANPGNPENLANPVVTVYRSAFELGA